MESGLKIIRLLFISLLMVTYWFGNLATPANAEETPDLQVTLGPKQTIDHEGMHTTGPSAQLAPDGTLHLAWGGEKQEDRGVFYLQAQPNQEITSEPIRVSPPTTPVATLHEPPALALGPKKDVYITWTTPHPKANGKLFTSLLLLSRSLDGGNTFQPPTRVNDDEAVTGHSFDHVTVGPNGTVHVAWLDNREGKKDPATYASVSRDQGATMTPSLKIDEPSCVCCRTFAATTQDGTVYLAWRKIFPGGMRETVVARSTDEGRTFSPAVIVGHDRWVYDGCPHRPATMGVDKHGRLYVTWYTEGPDDTPGVYLAYSDDQGKSFTPRRQLNMSKGTFPDHPQLAVNQEGHLLVAWEEQSPVRREVVFSASLDRGQTFSSPQKLNTKKSKSPSVALNNKRQGIIAWLEEVAFPKWGTVIQPLSLPAPQTASLTRE